MMACTFLGNLVSFWGQVSTEELEIFGLEDKLVMVEGDVVGTAVTSRVMMFLSWGTSVFPSSSTSSALLWTFRMLLSILSSLPWKTSAVTLSLKGSHSHLNLPNGMLIVVIRLHFLSSMTCQYLDLTSSKVKSMEPGRSGGMSSVVLLYHWFHLKIFVEILGFRHNLMEPSGFFTGRIELTHWVYSFTSIMMPSFNSLSSSAL